GGHARLPRGRHAPVALVEDRHAGHQRARLDRQDHDLNQYLTTSLRAASSVSATSSAQPSSAARLRSRRPIGRRRAASMLRNSAWPPSSTGTGSRLSSPRLSEISATISEN